MNQPTPYVAVDGGGSNSSRSKLWKKELRQLSDETGLTIIMSHYPPGTSKWNIDHQVKFVSDSNRPTSLEPQVLNSASLRTKLAPYIFYLKHNKVEHFFR